MVEASNKKTTTTTGQSMISTTGSTAVQNQIQNQQQQKQKQRKMTLQQRATGCLAKFVSSHTQVLDCVPGYQKDGVWRVQVDEDGCEFRQVRVTQAAYRQRERLMSEVVSHIVAELTKAP